MSLHHLLLSDAACRDFNTVAKIDPPLLNESSMLELREALKNGAIDMLTVLHHPQSAVNKDVAFAEASYGADAIGDALSLYYTYLVEGGLIGMDDLVRLTCKNNARITSYNVCYTKLLRFRRDLGGARRAF